MQPSMFNVQVPVAERDEVFLMNTLTDAQFLVSPDVAGLLDRVARGETAFNAEERETIDALVENGFVVDSRDTSERPLLAVLHQHARGHRAAAGHRAHHAAVQFRLRLLLPGRPRRLQQVRRTRCRSRPRPTWSRGSRSGSTRLRPEKFVLTLFGGEPLLNLPVAYYLAERCHALCEERGITQHISVITNGLLLTPEVVDRLTPYGLQGVKVTLDGDRDTHNRMRPLRGRQGTFDKIIENVRQVADKVLDHHRRQLRRVVGGQLPGAARLPARAGLRRHDREDQFQADHQGAGARAAERAHSADRRRRERQAARRHVHDQRGRRNRRGKSRQRVRLVPLRRREDVVPARGDAQARLPHGGRRAHGSVRDPPASTPTPSGRTARSTRAPGSPGEKTESIGHIDGRDEPWHAAARSASSA